MLVEEGGEMSVGRGEAMEAFGVIEILVVGTGNGIQAKRVARTMSSLMPHSVLVETVVGFGTEEVPRDGIRMSTTFHQERRVARLDPDRCGGCGRCVSACPGDAIAMEENGSIVVDPSRCDACGRCVRSCCREALTLSVMTDAYCHVTSTPFGRLVHAELAGEGRISEGLVFALRSEGRKQAKMVGADAIWVVASTESDSMLRVAAAGTTRALVVVNDAIVDAHETDELLERFRVLGIHADLLEAEGSSTPDLLEISRRTIASVGEVVRP